MALFGVAPTVMKPTALVLNILVASIVTVKLYRAGWFSWPIFWPFAVASIPCSFLGGAVSLPNVFYKPVVGCVLVYAAFRLLLFPKVAGITQSQKIPQTLAFASGSGIGFLSGLTGVGGGIFLSPLLLFRGWAQPKTTAAVSGAFILVNSLAGLLGHLSNVKSIPSSIPIWAIAAMAGGYIGVEYGSKRLGNVALNRLLAVVLAIAGLKMAFT